MFHNAGHGEDGSNHDEPHEASLLHTGCTFTQQAGSAGTDAVDSTRDVAATDNVAKGGIVQTLATFK